MDVSENRPPKKRLLAARALLISVTLGGLTANAQNNLTDLGPVAPGLGVNNGGQVVLLHYLYSNGNLTALPANFFGAGINSSGQVVGSVGPSCADVGLDAGGGCAFASYSNGALTTYPIFDGSLDPAVGNQAQAMNSGGVIVGDWTFTHGEGYPLVLTNGAFSSLQFPGSTCGGNIATEAGVAYAINDAGQIAGMLPYDPGTTGGCQSHAFLFSNGAYSDIGIGSAFAINASGQVTGSGGKSGGPPDYQITSTGAFVYSNGVRTDLGTLPGDTVATGYSINGLGMVVGTSQLSLSSAPGTNVFRAFYYDGVLNDLNTFVSANDPLQAFVSLTDARGINDSGLVLVNGVDSRDNAKHAYLLQVPLIRVTPGPLEFSSQPINTASAPKTVTITNAGATSIALGAASISSGFSVATDDCANSSLAPSGTCNIGVAYSPVAAGNPNGGLTLIAAGAPIKVPLSGTAPLTVSINPGATTVTAGVSVTLTWAASAGAACVATGGTSADGWTGSIAVSGSKKVTETTAGTYLYGLTCTADSQTQSAHVSVVVSWPAVTVTLSASPTTITAGQSTTLTWTADNATGCTASGGGPNDNWPGGKSTSGTAAITEPYAIDTASVTLTYTLTCTSSASTLSKAASTSVTVLKPASGSHGGGGSLDGSALALLFAVLAIRYAVREAGYELKMGYINSDGEDGRRGARDRGGAFGDARAIRQTLIEQSQLTR